MEFESKKEKEERFNSIINLFRDNDCEGFERAFVGLTILNRKGFIFYIFKNKHKLSDINSDILIRLCLDNL